MELTAVCQTCQHWDEGGGDEAGLCRRHAPVPQVSRNLSYAYAVWPTTQKTDWCGKWRLRKVE